MYDGLFKSPIIHDEKLIFNKIVTINNNLNLLSFLLF